MISVTLALLTGAFFLYFLRLLRGPSLTDRVMSIDGMILCGIAVMVVRAVDTGDADFLPVAVLFTLIGFVSTAVVARFIEGQDG
ncbi:MAG: monovalent cation/H+ antiporter complex subunit F [Aquihabitans sp.]